MNGELEFHWCQRLYERRAAQLILYGRALGLSHGEAEDVLQETFLALMQKSELPQQPENYCLRSFRNHALNHRRSLWRRLTRELESQDWFEKSPRESPEERAAMRHLAGLPLEQREVIVLKIWHRHTFEEIGGLLEISPNTAAGRYRYGLKKIKSQLEGAVYKRDEFIGDAVAFLAAAAPVGRLERRLFGARVTVHKMAWLGWLAPAAACALLTLSVLNSRNGISGASFSHGLTPTGDWSGAEFVSDGFADKQNHWAAVTSDWTNRSGFSSNVVSFRH